MYGWGELPPTGLEPASSRVSAERYTLQLRRQFAVLKPATVLFFMMSSCDL